MVQLKQSDIESVLRNVAEKYPQNLVDGQIRDIPRVAFNIGVALRFANSECLGDLKVCDLGGGIGLFSVGCAALGVKRIVLVDDFKDPVNFEVGDSVLSIHSSYGTEIDSRDVIATGIANLNGAFDVITTFDSMEHWHN